MCMVLSFCLTSCSGGSGGFDDLSTGNVSEVVSTTISQFIPDSGTVVIQQGATEQFFVTASAPLGRAVALTWTLNGVTVQSGSSNGFSLTGQSSNIGSHTLKVVATDGVTSDSKSWSVKVNGPPVLTKITQSRPKVTIGNDDSGNQYETFIEVQAIDPNGDSLSYTWTLDGLSSSYLTDVTPISPNTGRARLVGAESILGSVNINVEVSDGSAKSNVSWTAEINYFPMACNKLSQNQICTYAGNPNIGQGSKPDDSQVGIRIQPTGIAVDELNNLFLADPTNNVVWYWNRSNSDVTRLNISVPKGQMKVVAGTGEATSGVNGVAIERELNSPRGVAWLSDGNRGGTLWISEYPNHRVKNVDNAGIIRQVTGITGCNNPSGLSTYQDIVYVACRGTHRIVAWDHINSTLSVVAGSGTTGYTDNMAATSARLANPHDVFANADGLYIADETNHRIRFVRWSTAGTNKTFWNSSLSVAPGNILTILGSGATGDDQDQTPLAKDIPQPMGVVVVNNQIFVTTTNNNRDHIIMANNSGSTKLIGNVSVDDSKAKVITIYTGANNAQGYNGSGLPVESARIRDPYLMAYSSTDNSIYFSDYYNRRVRELRLDVGKIYDRVGSGDARNGNNGLTENPTLLTLVNSPGGLSWDKNANSLYYADMNNYVIRKVSSYGLVSAVYGSGSNSAPLSDNDLPSNVPTQMSYNSNQYTAGVKALLDGSILTLNGQGHHLRAWNRSNNTSEFAGTYIGSNRVSTIAGDILNPLTGGSPSINVDPVPPSTLSALSTQFSFPTDIDAHELTDPMTGAVTSRTLFVVDQGNHCIRQISNNGTLSTGVGSCVFTNNISTGGGFNGNDNATATSIQLDRPHGIAVDSTGGVYIADTLNHRVRYWNRGSIAKVIAGTTIPAGGVKTVICRDGNASSGDSNDNVPADLAYCDRPMGLAYFKDSTKELLCYAQFWVHNVRCLDVTTGKVFTAAGGDSKSPSPGYTFGFEQEGISATSAKLYNPKAITFDTYGDLYISEQNNHIIRKVKLSP